MNKIKLSISLDTDIFIKLKELAAINNKNISSMICILLRRLKEDGNYIFDQERIKYKE